MNYIVFDSSDRINLLPFTFTRPSAGIRIGILTIAEKWEKYLQTSVSYLTEEYLQKKFALKTAADNMLINGTVCPDEIIVREIASLNDGEALVKGNVFIAVRLKNIEDFSEEKFAGTKIESASNSILKITHPYDIFSLNGKAIEDDFLLLTKGRKSQQISNTNRYINPENIFIEEGAKVEFAILNASTGSIYIGKDAEVMEGCKIRGPFAMCEHAGLKMDAKIYGPTTVGPHCKVGGEVNNAVFFSYSNKGHDGFLGNAVVGEWCNIGADTNNSNLKNTYDEVKLWSYKTERFEKTGLTFCGLMFADHAKCGINTMFNTGTVVGVAANIFGSGFPRNFVPSFAWGGAQGFDTFTLSKFFKTAEAMCSRRNIEFTQTDKEILTEVFNQSQKFRFWEGKNS
ncbi:MAG: GlmU family protein [Bacteroidota bacterium]